MAILRAFAAAALLASIVLSASCAKTGDPQPPLLRIPKPAGDLAARQLSDEIVLSLSEPVENTDLSPVTTLAHVQIFRRLEDRTSPSIALGEEEFLRGVQQIIQVTADQLAGHRQGGRLVFRDPLPDRSKIFQQRARYAVRFINTKNQTAGLSNQVQLEPVALAEAPKGLTSRLSQDSIRIQWEPPQQNIDGSTPASLAGYNIYREEDVRAPLSVPLNKEPLRVPEFEDRRFEFDKTYYYGVTVVGSARHPAESRPSAILTVQTTDTFAPSPPGDLNLVSEKAVVILLWVAPPEGDVAGYRVYRKEEGAAEKERLGNELIQSLSYRDEKAQSGKKYQYSVTAVDTRGNEGPPASSTIEVP